MISCWLLKKDCEFSLYIEKRLFAEHMRQHMALFKHPIKLKADSNSNVPDEGHGAGTGTHMKLCCI